MLSLVFAIFAYRMDVIHRRFCNRLDLPGAWLRPRNRAPFLHKRMGTYVSIRRRKAYRLRRYAFSFSRDRRAWGGISVRRSSRRR